MKNVLRFFAGMIVASVFLTGCISIGGSSKQLEVHSKTGTHTYNVEIVDTRESREQGLSGRENLADDAGMWFVYDHEHFPAFWMPDMNFSLDIIFFDKEMKVIDVFANVPPCATESCDHYVPAIKSQFILELNAGKAKEMKLVFGDIAELK